MRILVLRGGALGDFIVTIPALQLLRRRWPDAFVVLVGNARAAELALLTGDLDEVYSQHEARWAKLFSAEKLPEELAEWLKSFDLILNYWPDSAGTIDRHFAHRGNTYFACPSSIVLSRPAARHFIEPLKSLGLSADEYSTHLTMPKSVEREAQSRLKHLDNFIAIHPGSGSPTKNWPGEKWSELISKFASPVLLTVGEAERDDWNLQDSARVVIAREWPLPLLSVALSRCRLFVGHDSGVSHLAAASGASCLLLFGPTDPEVWAPVPAILGSASNRVSTPTIQVLRPGRTLEKISVADVWSAACALGAG